MLSLLVIGGAVLGLVLGSFLSVVTSRVPQGQSIVRPRSQCPTCAHSLGPRDLVPVVSWLWHRGRCRYCHAPISPRYPLIESASSAIVVLTIVRLGVHVVTLAYLAALLGLLALAVTDFEHMVLPRSMTLVTSALTLALLVGASWHSHHWRALGVAVVCAGVWSALFGALHLVNQRWMGRGDVFLALLLGLTLGYLGVSSAVVGFFIANVVGAIIGVALVVSGHSTRQQPLPYGVFLVIGTMTVVWWGPEIIRAMHLSGS